MTAYAYVINRNTGKIVKWEPWPFHLDTLDIIDRFNDILLFKARQLGWSWLVGGWSENKVQFNEGVKGLFLSQGEREAWALLAKSKFIHSHLPDELKLTLKHPDSRETFDFEAHEGVIEALPSTPKAGRSTDATFVVRDELSTHPFGKENFASIGPTIDAGGKSIDLSTIDKLDGENHFTERVNRAIFGAKRKDLPSGLTVFYGGESGAILVFGGWKLRPVREESLTIDEWYEKRVKPKYSPLQREQEYPETIEEALKPAITAMYFDAKALEDMLLHIQFPISQEEIPTYNGVIEVYKLPETGVRYCLFTDPSGGVEDPFHTVVVDSRTGEGVCEAHGMLHHEKVAEIHDLLVRKYNDAYNSNEINQTVGGRVDELLIQLKTPNRALRRKPDGTVVSDKYGFVTSKEHKKIMFASLEEAIRRRTIIPYRKETITEFQSLLTVEGEPLPLVPKGKHDDAIMAWAGVCRLRKYIPVVTSGITRTSPMRWS